MTDEQLNAIRTRRAALPYAPWRVMDDSDESGAVWVSWVSNERVCGCEVDPSDDTMPPEQARTTATFIAHAPSDIDALLSEIARLRAALEHYAGPNNWGEAEIYTTARRLWEANENGYTRAQQALEEGE